MILEKKLNDTNTQLQDAKYSISELEEECVCRVLTNDENESMI